jgi:hypothetical protein
MHTSLSDSIAARGICGYYLEAVKDVDRYGNNQ